MLDVIDVNGKYEDEHGLAVIVGFVKNYVVWRRPGCVANVCTLNDFAKRFRKAAPNVKLRGAPIGASRLSDGLGGTELQKEHRTQTAKKAVILKLPLHPITAKFNNNKTFRVR